MKPAHRRIVGSIVLLLYLPAYIALAATLGAALADAAPTWTLAPYYAAAGIIWVAPLYPLFVWMRART